MDVFRIPFADGLLQRLPTSEVASHEPDANGELAAPQMLTVHVVT